jgi:ankyrin repeat protein
MVSSQPGHNLLNFAAGNGKLDCIAFLLEKGAQVNSPPGTYSPLHYAAHNGHASVLALLLDKVPLPYRFHRFCV